MLLIPHTVAGVWTARESLKEDGEADDPSILAAAAVVAAGVTVTLPLIRIALQKGLRIPNYLVGLAEDYVALQLGTRGDWADDGRGPKRSPASRSRGSARRSSRRSTTRPIASSPALKKVGIEV